MSCYDCGPRVDHRTDTCPLRKRLRHTDAVVDACIEAVKKAIQPDKCAGEWADPCVCGNGKLANVGMVDGPPKCVDCAGIKVEGHAEDVQFSICGIPIKTSDAIPASVWTNIKGSARL